jgi:hypothetical protein
MAVVMLLAAGCTKRPYYPAGGPGPLDVSGIYAMEETLYSGNCPGVAARKGLTRVEVKHDPGASMLKLTVDAEPFDARIRSDGSFDTRPLVISRGAVTFTTSLQGRFTDSTFYARFSISTTEVVNAPSQRVPETRACTYQFRWAARKM